MVDKLHAQYHVVRHEFNDTVHALRMENCKIRFHASSTHASTADDGSSDASEGLIRREARLGTSEAVVTHPLVASSCAPISAKEDVPALLPPASEVASSAAVSETLSEKSLDLGLPLATHEVLPRVPGPTSACSKPNLRIEIQPKTLESIVDSSMVESWTPTSSVRSPFIAGDTERKAAIRRLQARLGVVSDRATITGGMLYRAVVATGVTKYNEETMTDFIERLNNAPPRNLRQDRPNRVASAIKVSFSRVNSLSSAIDTDAQLGKAASSSTIETTSESINSSTISFQRFVNYLLDPQLRTYVAPEVYRTMKTIADVLLAGDTNKIIAELTNTRIDDLASPQPSMALLTALEPVVSFVIVLNCVWVALQLDSDASSWGPWVVVDVAFIGLFLGEVLLRVKLEGYDLFCTGRDWAWNVFDSFILALAVADLLAVSAGSPTAFRAIRMVRMLRVARLIKRDGLRELTLMVRGFCGSLRALGWAVVFLLGTLFVFAVYIRQMVSLWSGLPADEVTQDAHTQFATIPRSMFTILRCMTGDCTDSFGNSLTAALVDEFGMRFMVAYLCAVLFITCGLFSMIIAVYVEATLSAAKLIDEGNRLMRDREAVRVAHTTKALLKRFCSAAKVASGQDAPASDTDLTDTRRGWKALVMSKIVGEDVHAEELFRDHESAAITKDIYMVVIQDRRVQKLMDDLDVPRERAHLFDSLDAAGVGSIQAIDLVSGLLQVRGHARRSDVIGCKLVMQVVRDMLREMQSSGRRELPASPPSQFLRR